MMSLKNNRLIPEETTPDDMEEADAFITNSKLQLSALVGETYRAFYVALPEGAATLSSEGVLLHCNPRLLEMLQKTSFEVIGLSFLDCISPEDHHLFRQMLNDEHCLTVDLQLLKQKDLLFPVQLSVSRLAVEDMNLFCLIVVDLCERYKTEDRMRLTSLVFENSLESITVTDADNKIIEVNEAFTRITGYSKAEALGKGPGFLKSGEHTQNFYANIWGSITNSGNWHGEIWNKRKNGEKFCVWASISAIKNIKGIACNYVSIETDITAHKLHQKQLEHIAHFDSLTDIPNRVLLADRLKQAIAQSQRENKMMAVCYLDLDGFKPINDSYGHETGDQMLIAIAKCIGETIRNTDTVARIGGDEFVVLLLGLDRFEECLVSLRRLMESIAQPVRIDNQYFKVTASIGVTLYPQDNSDQDVLLRHADQSMYRAKELGKNRYHFYDTTQEQKIKSRLQNIQRINEALVNNEFVLHYQPKVELQTFQTVGVEALIRWQHPELGLLQPSEFLPMIEAAELDIELGEWVTQEALKQMSAWHAEGLTIEVSINIAARHLQSINFVNKLQQSLNLHPLLPKGLLQIEILETAALEDVFKIKRIIEACRNIGVSFALDDFGTGYSTLAYLRSLPADTLKIDQTFVRDMLVDSDDMAIVQGIIALANAFKRTTVAEGVETNDHLTALKNLGCHIGQGYGIAKPMPANKFPNWLMNWEQDQYRGRN